MDLLERDHEMSILGRAASAVVAGDGGRLVVVTGEAGIGKTALIRAFLETTGCRQIVGRCDDLTIPVPLGPFLDFARAVGTSLAVDMGACRRQVVEMLASEPTIAVIEDLHWAGDAAIDVVSHLGRRIAGMPLLLVVSTRSRHDPGLARAVGGTPPDRHTTIELTPLTRSAIDTLVAGSGHNAARIHAESGGNPFLVAESMNWADGSIPPRVALSSVSRLGQVSTRAGALARLLAVVPAGVSWEMLAMLEPGAERYIDELERIRVLEADNHHVQFRHQLIRRAVADTMTGAERRLCHRRVLDQLLKMDTDPAVVGHHAFGAGDWETLVEYALISARSSVESGNYVDAAAQLDRASAHRGELTLEGQAAFSELFARALLPSGHETAGLEEALRAAELFETVGDLLGEARMLRLASIPAHRLGNVDESLRLQHRAQSILDDVGDTDQKVAARAASAQTMALRSDWRRARDESDRAVVESESCSPGTRSISLAVRSDIRRVLGDEAGGRADWQAAFDLASFENDTDRLTTLLLNRVAVSLGTLQIAELGAELEAAWSFMRTIDAPRSQRSLAGFAASADVLAGRWDRAIEHVAPDGTIPVPTPTGTGPTLTAGLVAARRGSQAGVEAIVEAFDVAWPMRDIQRLGPIGAALAEMAWLGRLDVHPSLPSIVELAHASGHLRHASEMSVWCRRLGLGGPDPPTGGPEPFRLMFEGRWQPAVLWWDRHGCPYQAVLAMAFSGDAEAMSHAVALAVGLGADPVADRVRRALRDQGVSVGRGRSRAAVEHPLGLTPRQVEVIGLLAEGLTNREIAERLFVTPKTVDHHLGAIYRRLGVNDRRAAAAIWASSGHDVQ